MEGFNQNKNRRGDTNIKYKRKYSIANLIRKLLVGYPVFVAWYREKKSIWLPVIFDKIDRVLNVLEYFFFVRTVFGFILKYLKVAFAWCIRPRLIVDRMIFRIQLVLIVAGVILFLYIWFYQWRLLSGVVYSPSSGFVRHPIREMTTGYEVADANVVDYIYLVERYAESASFYDRGIPNHAESFWKVITTKNKHFFGWRPSWVTWAEIREEYYRYTRYHLHFDKPNWLYYHRDIFVYWVWDMNSELNAFLLKYGGQDMLDDIDWSTGDRLKGAFWDAYHEITVTWNGYTHLANLPKYILTEFPDEWYLRHESDGMWKEFVDEAFDSYWDWRHDFWAPRYEYLRELAAYKRKIKPPLPNWGPGRLVIRDCWNDIKHEFWYRYLSPTRVTRDLSRVIDVVTLYSKLGPFVVSFITYVYGIPFLLVTYFTAEFYYYILLPFKMFFGGVLVAGVDGFFLYFQNFFLFIEGLFYYTMVNPNSMSIESNRVINLAYSFVLESWMYFTIFPFCSVMYVLPLFLSLGVFRALIKPLRYFYHLVYDHANGTLRYSEEVLEIFDDQVVIVQEAIGFVLFLNTGYLRSVLRRLPYHLIPFRWIPFKLRLRLLRSTYKYLKYTGSMEDLLAIARYQQYREDMKFILKHGEVEFERHLDERFWMEIDQFNREFIENQCISIHKVLLLHTFLFFLLVGNVVFPIFAVMAFIKITTQKLIFTKLFTDAVFANGLTPFVLGTGGHPKDRRTGTVGWDEDRDEEWYPYKDFEDLFYSPNEPGTVVDHYAEIVLVVYKWFFLHSVLLVLCFLLALYLFKSLRGALAVYAGEFVYLAMTAIFVMGWSAYSFSGGFPEIDLLGLRGPLNLLMFGEEWLFDNYLNGLFTIDYQMAKLEYYFDTNVKFRVEWKRYRRNHMYHRNSYWGVYMKLYNGMIDLNPWKHRVQGIRDEYSNDFFSKEFLDKWEPKFKEWREYFWGEEENYDDLDKEDPKKELENDESKSKEKAKKTASGKKNSK